MTTDDLVQALGEELVPVRRAPPVATRALRFGVLAAGFVLSYLIAHGVRPDWVTLLSRVSFLREQAALLVLSGISVWAVFQLATPGRSGAAIARVGPILALLAWVGLVLARAVDAPSIGPAGWKCAARTGGLGAAPFVALVVGLRREPILEPRRMLAFGLWGVSSLAMFGTQWLCTRDAPLHVLVWHCGPVLLAGLAGLGAGAWLARSAGVFGAHRLRR